MFMPASIRSDSVPPIGAERQIEYKYHYGREHGQRPDFMRQHGIDFFRAHALARVPAFFDDTLRICPLYIDSACRRVAASRSVPRSCSISSTMCSSTWRSSSGRFIFFSSAASPSISFAAAKRGGYAYVARMVLYKVRDRVYRLMHRAGAKVEPLSGRAIVYRVQYGIYQILYALVFAGRYGQYVHAQLLFQAGYVYGRARSLHLVHHVKRNDHGHDPAPLAAA